MQIPFFNLRIIPGRKVKSITEWEVKMMYEDFVPERLAKLRTRKGVSARDMSLSLGQANNYINNIKQKITTLHAVLFLYL